MIINHPSLKRRPGIAMALFVLLTKTLMAQTTLEVNPDVSQVSPGSNVALNINIGNVTDLHMASVAVSFDKPVVQYTGSCAGSFLKLNEPGYSVFYYEAQIPKGAPDTVRIDQAILGGVSVKGSSDLFSLTFKALKEGTCLITISMVEMRNLANYFIDKPVVYNGIIVVGNNGNKSPRISSTPAVQGMVHAQYNDPCIRDANAGHPG